MTTVSFLCFLALFLIVGLLSVFKSKNTTEDYLIAGKSIPPWLAALSAIATNNSGYMFIGMIGLTYLTGLSSIWLMFGWIVGDLFISLLTLRHIRQVSHDTRIHSFGGLIAHWHGNDHKILRRISGLLILFFLTIYAAAQLKAGSKATMVILDWGPHTGILIGAIIVLAYSWAGGIRASIWTDAAQSIFMIGGMGLLVYTGIKQVDGIENGLAIIQSQTQAGYLNWLPTKPPIKILLFIIGWFFGGVAVIGQPHIVIRFMGLNSEKNINKMRVYYYTWYTLFYAATILVGLLCRAIFPNTGQFESELALPTLTQQLLPGFFQGIILAALFAATMSTADSLILSCSAALSRDFIQKESHSLRETKISTITVVVMASIIAIFGDRSVFRLVLDAWGLLASAFVPLIIFYSFNQRCSEKIAISGVIAGFMVFIFWEYSGLGKIIYSVAPGILSGLVFLFITTRLIQNPQIKRT